MPDVHTDKAWHLDKKVPLALIFAIAMQTAGALIWASKVDTTVASVVEDVSENKQDIKTISTIEPRLVRVETDIDYIRRSVDSNRTQLKSLDDKLTELLRATRN